MPESANSDDPVDINRHRKKIVTIIGARPQFIKAAVVCHAIRDHSGRAVSGSTIMSENIVHTGQHFDDVMSRIFFEELEIPLPHYNLGVCEKTHGAMTGEMLQKVEDVLIRESPDMVLVYGDTNSTLASALSAVKLHIPVTHIEAGLRSFNRSMPEEINRVVVDHISSLHFCPSQNAMDNLKHEGIEDSAHLVGDVMYDACLHYGSKVQKKDLLLDELSLGSKKYVLATVHRAENTDSPGRFHAILDGLSTVSKELPIVFPLHPRTRRALKNNGFRNNYHENLKFINPLGYLDTLALEKNARIIITDSGGVQKEAYFFKVPCLILREETEWIELLDAGWNVLVGADAKVLCQAARHFLSEDTSTHDSMVSYGDGDSGFKIFYLVCQFLKGEIPHGKVSSQKLGNSQIKRFNKKDTR